MLNQQKGTPGATAIAGNVELVFEKLEQGLGHELVNDGNVDALIEMAQRAGHRVLEQELREWKASC